jgi:hypothetical protein
MSVASLVNTGTAALVGIAFGSRARKISKDTGITLGHAALDTVEVGAKILGGTVKGLAAALPATYAYLKGMSVEALIGSEALTKFRIEFTNATPERRDEMYEEIGAKHMQNVIAAFKEEELIKIG